MILAVVLLTTKSYAQQLEINVLDQPIMVDGLLEDQWMQSDSIVQFIQLEPSKGANSTRNTTVRVVQYDQSIYFSFVNYINPGERVAARIQRRDQLDPSDDIISVVIDTYFDKRNSFLFQVNALGTLTDAKVTDDGRKVDLLWDTEWDAKTSVTDEYWLVEIRIPLESIQYGPNSTSWGANFGRVIRANQETAWWTSVTDSYRISQGGMITGIQINQKNKHNLRVFPYGTLRYENSDITEIYNKMKADAGVDLQYQYSSNLTANLTYNPDFATVEGDKEQINLTPWELRFPDKRLFFQDGNEMFGTRISTFYSRRIGDMRYGGKMIGKAGKYQFNTLIARTKEGPENPAAWHNAIRIKRDILESSILGFTYADKITDTAYVRSYSLDYVLNLGKTWKLTGQMVTSAPGDFKSHSAWFVRFARENNIYHYHLRYSNFGENFQDNVNETGFIRDDDRHELDSDISYRFWLDNSIKYLSLEGRNNVFWGQDGTFRSWKFRYGGRLYLKNRISFEMQYFNEFKLLDKEYYNHSYGFELGYNTDEASFIKFDYNFGKNFDLDFQLYEFKTRFQLFKKLTVNYELTYIKFSPDPEFESTTINVVGLDYFFTNDLWIRVFTQSNSQSDKFYLYGLLGWRFKPPLRGCLLDCEYGPI